MQRISRLTPLADVLASFDLSVGPVAIRDEPLASALGRTLAADVFVADGLPAAPLALRDGYALSSDTTSDASNYAPAPLSPPPARVETGDPLPVNTDAVALLDSIEIRNRHAETLSPVAPGDGVLAAGGEVPPGTKLRLAGGRLRRIDIAMLTAIGITSVPVREPKVRIVRASEGGMIDGAAALIACAVNEEGAIAIDDGLPLADALQRDDVDALVSIGGTGSGRKDDSVRALAEAGRVAFHGIAIAPGETTALGFIGHRPVLMLPGRFDSALAGWLTVGRRMLARLCFRLLEEQPFAAELGRKIASPLGLAEVVPVRRRFGKVEPLAGGHLPLHALARAEGWILVPADSEGYPEGSRVVVRPFP